MIRSIFKIFLILIVIVIVPISYFSLIGIETRSLNKLIEENIKKIEPKIDVELNSVKLIFDPIKLEINAKTYGPSINYNKKTLNLEIIKTNIPLTSLFKDKFSTSNLFISTKYIKIKDLITFARSIKNSPELFIFDKTLSKGLLIANINLNFSELGKINDDYKINGFIKDASIDLLNKKKIKNINFAFNAQNKKIDIDDLNFSFKNINTKSKKISIKDINNIVEIKGVFENEKINLSETEIDNLTNNEFNNKIKKIIFSSKNKFLLKVTKKYKIKDFQLASQLYLEQLLIQNSLNLNKYLPQQKKFIEFKEHKLDVKFAKKNLTIEGTGQVLIQNELDKVSYQIKNFQDEYSFQTNFDFYKNPIYLKFFNYKKKENTNLILQISGIYKQNQILEFKDIILKSDKDKFEIKDISIDKNFKISSIRQADFNFIDSDNQQNNISLKKVLSEYEIKGDNFNANKLLDEMILADSPKKSKIFSENFNLSLYFDKVLIDNQNQINDLKGSLRIVDNEIKNAQISASFNSNEKINFTIVSKNRNKITTFYSPRAEPFVKRYKFIKGFNEGSLDFYSIKDQNSSTSKLKIYDFKLKKLPALTKVLTLASLKGMADLLSGEGIRFNEFEMNFENKDSLTTFNEIYAIGPAISILMDGYIEKSKLVSFRGTLVPATTINKVIGSIPILGDILVGSKTGEGVFGVSFKIKGPPKNLETTVNPIKTLTPRFITRTLEKIKKN